MNNYETIDNLVKEFKYSPDETGRKSAMQKIIEMFRPLVIAAIKRAYDEVSSDLLQDGYLRIIELTEAFDEKRGIKFPGYLKVNLMYFFRNKKSKKRVTLIYVQPELLRGKSVQDEASFELMSLKKVLKPKENYIIKRSVIDGDSLKMVSKELNISYSYAKRLKASAAKKLRKEYEC